MILSGRQFIVIGIIPITMTSDSEEFQSDIGFRQDFHVSAVCCYKPRGHFRNLCVVKISLLKSVF